MGTEAIDARFCRRDDRRNDPVNGSGGLAGLAGCLKNLKFEFGNGLQFSDCKSRLFCESIRQKIVQHAVGARPNSTTPSNMSRMVRFGAGLERMSAGLETETSVIEGAWHAPTMLVVTGAFFAFLFS